MWHARAASGWVAVYLLLGCASRGSEKSDPPTYNNVQVGLEVENHNWSDIVVYLMRGNSSHRLGMVTALSTSRFSFPFRHIGTTGNARLRAHPIGGTTGFTSEDLLVQPGQSIKWTLESDLTRSFLGVY
ncbi:MAG: hypothetical protein ACR2HK_04825 [Gemmatimonadales bacterium]